MPKRQVQLDEQLIQLVPLPIWPRSGRKKRLKIGQNLGLSIQFKTSKLTKSTYTDS